MRQDRQPDRADSASGGFCEIPQFVRPGIQVKLKARMFFASITERRGAGYSAPKPRLPCKAGWSYHRLRSGTALMLAQMGGRRGVQFDATKFTYLGRPVSDDRVIFVRTASELKTAQDLQDRPPAQVPSQGVDRRFLRDRTSGGPPSASK